jgi:hypothetical protein
MHVRKQSGRTARCYMPPQAARMGSGLFACIPPVASVTTVKAPRGMDVCGVAAVRNVYAEAALPCAVPV